MPLSKICMSNILGYLYADPKIGMVQPNASKSVQVALAPLKNGEKRKNFELQVIIFVNYTMKNIVSIDNVFKYIYNNIYYEYVCNTFCNQHSF